MYYWLLLPSLVSALSTNYTVNVARQISCTEASALPNVDDCTILHLALHRASAGGYGNKVLAWVPQVTFNPASKNNIALPKAYQIVEQSPGLPERILSCEMAVTYFPRQNSLGYDMFSLRDVAANTESITNQCLAAQAKTGFAFPGRYRTAIQLLKRYSPEELDARELRTTSAAAHDRAWDLVIVGKSYKLREIEGSQANLNVNVTEYR